MIPVPPSEVTELLDILGSRGLTLACAESCTGGMIGAAITETPGASSIFMGSAVTYSNDSKESVLGVSHTTLLDHGAVAGIGTHEQLLESCPLYREIHYSQYEKKEAV